MAGDACNSRSKTAKDVMGKAKEIGSEFRPRLPP